MQIQKPKHSYDLVVVGGGMVGASFACALSHGIGSKSLSILVVEAVASTSSSVVQPSFDARATALSYGSSRIFERMGLWSQLAEIVTRIKEIHVSDKGRFGAVHLSHEDHKLDALGYVIENRNLGVVLNAAMQISEGIDLYCPARITSIKPVQSGMSLEIAGAAGNVTVEASLVVLAVK